jgi:PadR family transcriptional regulator, regulatory protein AphA
LKPLPEDRHRSPFVFAMLFSHLLPHERVESMLDNYIRVSEEKLAQLSDMKPQPQTPGEKFVSGFGRAVYEAMLEFLRTHRHEIEQPKAEAAE